MTSARQIAAKWERDPRLRRLCQTVVPVAGLIAEAGATWREQDHRALTTIAALDRAEADALTLTGDRFVADHDVAVTRIEREDLLERLGIFGVRTAISLIRLGAASTAGELAGALADRSGVNDLRHLLATVLTNRRDILKARVALTGLDAALGTLVDPVHDEARHELERIGANVHEFEEIHLLNGLRSGAITFREAEHDELERVLGGIGRSTTERLGIEPGTDPTPAILDGIERWRRRSENPMSSLAVAQASRLVIRTYEGMLQTEN